LIACALKKEAKGLSRCLGDSFPIVVTGLGVDRTLNKLQNTLTADPPEILLFTGMCGQLDPTLGLGDFVFPEAWKTEAGTTFRVDEKLVDNLRGEGWLVEGLGLTVRKPVVKQRERLRLFKETGARICDMESSAALMIADSFGVPCIAPKIVSDTAESGMLSFYRRFDIHIEMLGKKVAQLGETIRKNTPS
jgi:nucleoside phosphorylase